MAKSISAVVVLLLFIAMAGAEEKRFMSVARLLVGGAEVNPKLENGEPIPDDFYATNIEFLYGAEIHKRAYVRVHSLHPEWEPHPFKIEAARIPNTRILVVRATGEGQQFVQAFPTGTQVCSDASDT